MNLNHLFWGLVVLTTNLKSTYLPPTNDFRFVVFFIVFGVVVFYTIILYDFLISPSPPLPITSSYFFPLLASLLSKLFSTHLSSHISPHYLLTLPSPLFPHSLHHFFLSPLPTSPLPTPLRSYKQSSALPDTTYWPPHWKIQLPIPMDS